MLQRECSSNLPFDSQIHSETLGSELPGSGEAALGDLPTSTIEGLALCTIIGFDDEVPILRFELDGATHVHKAIAVTGVPGNLTPNIFYKRH